MGGDRRCALRDLPRQVVRIAVADLDEIGDQGLGEVAHGTAGHHREGEARAAVVGVVGVEDLTATGGAPRALDGLVDRLDTERHRIRFRRFGAVALDETEPVSCFRAARGYAGS